MICFEVFRNGEKLCRAGKRELLVLGSNISFVSGRDGREDELNIHVGGLYDDEVRGQVHPRWIERQMLDVGDEIIIRIIESETADEPVGEQVDSKEFAETQERKYYERLKAKFENDNS
ncbi:MAG: hypothetical protein ABI999_01805 [Acidobacteriota bacterium]